MKKLTELQIHVEKLTKFRDNYYAAGIFYSKTAG